MTIEELVAQLEGIAPDSSDPTIDWGHRGNLWARLAAEAEDIVSVICARAFCTAQEWDNRLDCSLRLHDGSVIGEMISLSNLTVTRLRETASRLRRRASGEEVNLMNPILPPIFNWQELR